MKKNNRLILGVLFGWMMMLAMPVFAQEEGEPQNGNDAPSKSLYNYVLVARSYGDSIVLRWAPQNAGVWMLANHYGWNIYRLKTDAELAANPADTTVEIKLNAKPIRPLTLDEMKAKYDTTHIYVGVAAQALYGQSFYNPKESEGMDNYIFRRDQEQSQRQLMAYTAAEGHIDAADALGLRFVDKTVKKGETYTYILECLIPEDIAEMPKKVMDVACKPFERDYQEVTPTINFLQNSPYTAFIYWSKNKLSGYYIDRSEDGGKHWTTLNQAPIYGYDPDKETYEVFGEEVGKLLENNVGYQDSLLLNKKYIYRVRAFDGFGDYAPDRKSEPFEMADFIPPCTPVLQFIFPEDNKVCPLQWTMDKQDEDLKGFVVTFSDNPAGPWNNVTDLLPPKTREWTDKNAHDRGRGYYRVFAMDNSGNVSYSLSQINNIEDDMPPAAPKGLAGIVDTAGIVYLQWTPNTEKDILGYRVYFANQPDHDFIQKTGRRYSENHFWDTLSLNTLTKYIFYYVVAEDNSHNFSKPSDTLAIPVPDIVPPGVAVLKDYTQTDESVTFTWLQSTSNDVIAYVVYRKKDNEKQWKQIRIITPDELVNDGPIVLTDYPEPSPTNYNYCIEVFDNSRLSSGKTGQTTVRFRGAAVINIPLTLKATLNKAGTCVNLDFTYEYESKNDYYGVVFKSVNDGPAYACGSFHRGETTFTDCGIRSGEKVSYQIQMFLGRGKRSQLSDPVKVLVK